MDKVKISDSSDKLGFGNFSIMIYDTCLNLLLGVTRDIRIITWKFSFDMTF